MILTVCQSKIFYSFIPTILIVLLLFQKKKLFIYLYKIISKLINQIHYVHNVIHSRYIQFELHNIALNTRVIFVFMYNIKYYNIEGRF